VFHMLGSFVKGNDKVRALHATGKGGNEKYGAIAASTGLNKAPNIEIREYIYDMHRQLAAADIVICRAGAITIAENCCMGKASILIPSPNVTDDHQYKNAKVLADAGAALLLKESETDGKVLTDTVRELVVNKEKRNAMSAAAKARAMSNAAEVIADIVIKESKKA